MLSLRLSYRGAQGLCQWGILLARRQLICIPFGAVKSWSNYCTCWDSLIPRLKELCSGAKVGLQWPYSNSGIISW